MILIYVAKLGLNVSQTNIGIQKINDFTFRTFKMVQASF